MRNFLKGYVMITGSLLVGYSLAYPIKLANYFFDKPGVDILIYISLFVSAFATSLKLFSRSKFVKYLAFALLILPLTWLRFDFWLYSTIDSPQFITYIETLVLGVSAYALTKFHFVTKPSKGSSLILLSPLAIGFLISFFFKQYDFSVIVMLFMASSLSAVFWNEKRAWSITTAVLGIVLLVVTNFFEYPRFFESQSRYHDKVVFSVETDIQRIDVTEWKGDYWFYADGINQFSSIDSWLFYEPFAYPILELTETAKSVLVIGGENGMLINELSKAGLSSVDQIPIDLELLELSQNETLFTDFNNYKSSNDLPKIIQEEVFSFLNESELKYDLIFVDVADPIDLERNQYFTLEFYELIKATLADGGLMVTQSGSPYFATEAFAVVQRTLEASGFNTLAYHNQVLTLGEWSWMIGSTNLTEAAMRKRLTTADFKFGTKWLNQEAMQMMMSFGKPARKIDDLQINTMNEPTLYKYYLNGNYALK